MDFTRITESGSAHELRPGLLGMRNKQNPVELGPRGKRQFIRQDNVTLTELTPDP
jgi:hypothetical protein